MYSTDNLGKAKSVSSNILANMRGLFTAYCKFKSTINAEIYSVKKRSNESLALLLATMLPTKLLHIKIQPRLKTITKVRTMCKLVQSFK